MCGLVPSKILPVTASFLVDKASNWSHVDNSVSPSFFMEDQVEASERTEAPQLPVKVSRRVQALQLLEDC